jgi:hypothetical protein
MIPPFGYKHFANTKKRTLEAACDRFLRDVVPNAGGPKLRQLLAEKLLALFREYTVEQSRLEPGQMLWVAVDQHTRASSRHARYKPVILTLITKEECMHLANKDHRIPPLMPSTIARLCNEAYAQGALLSMRDIALIFKRDLSNISHHRLAYEEQTRQTLPFVGSLQDSGTTTTHKAMILRKVLIEKKDMLAVRHETRHSQRSIDRYLRDYHRVETLLLDGKDTRYISQVTRMSCHLIEQYQRIFSEVRNALAPAA